MPTGAPKSDHAPERSQLESAPMEEMNVRPQARPARPEHGQRHEPAAECCRPGRAADSATRKSQVTKNQRPIEPGVDQVGNDDRDHDRTHPMLRLQRCAQHQESEKRKNAGNGDPGEKRRERE